MAAILKALVDFPHLVEEGANALELLHDGAKRVWRKLASRGEVSHLGAQLAEQADLVRLALEVDDLQVEQVVGHVRSVADAAARAQLRARPIHKNRMRLSHT